MIVGPTKALFMDEISTGLDSSTTFQIVTCLQHFVHITDATILVSLLQPAPETFDLFDDVILMAEGKIVYHGPCANVLEFFEDCGFKCPPRKGAADFLQEVPTKLPYLVILFFIVFWTIIFWHVSFGTKIASDKQKFSKSLILGYDFLGNLQERSSTILVPK